LLYSASFYTDRREATKLAAETVLGLVRNLRPFSSVIDVGCGTGTWLTTASQLGAERLVGLEGPWVKPGMLDSSKIDFIATDLSKPLPINQTFDLAISLEVAEHLPASRAVSLVDELCGLSDTVLFSAAVPNQRGTGHINEQWQSYWAELFAAHGYTPVDCIRPQIWGKENIPAWYKQNSILYVKGPSPAVEAGMGALDLIHPYYLMRAPDLRYCVSMAVKIPAALGSAIRKRLVRARLRAAGRS